MMSEVENEKFVEFTVKIPKSWFEFLNCFSELISVSIEDLLKPQIDGLIRSIIEDPTVFYDKGKMMDRLKIS